MGSLCTWSDREHIFDELPPEDAWDLECVPKHHLLRLANSFVLTPTSPLCNSQGQNSSVSCFCPHKLGHTRDLFSFLPLCATTWHKCVSDVHLMIPSLYDLGHFPKANNRRNVTLSGTASHTTFNLMFSPFHSTLDQNQLLSGVCFFVSIPGPREHLISWH